jgi:two-component system LytT family response regulator
MKAVIIDDEKLIRHALSELIRVYCPDIDIVAEASGVHSGLEIVANTEFDVLLLDIKMKDGTGYDLLAQIPEKHRSFHLIFTTAFDEFALKAIKENAVDYLLKPIDPEELQQALKKVTSKANSGLTAYENLLRSVFHSGNQSKISLSTAERIYYIDVSDIIRCESSNNYTYFYLRDKSKLLITKTMKEYEDILIQKQFMRVHRSHLINTKEIISFEKQKGNYVCMSDGAEVPVSQRKKEELLAFLRSSLG